MTTPAVDFHCHLDLYPDPLLAAQHCREQGTYLLSVTTTPKAWEQSAKLASRYVRIRTALGLHPQIAHERIGELPLFDELLPKTRYVGEVGLDGSPDFKVHWEAQSRVLNHVLASSAQAGGRIISVHSRRAATHVLDALARHPDAGIPVLHWFSGTKAELERAVAMGCWFSVGSAMAIGKRGRDLISAMPKDHILTETDGPFAAIGGKPLPPGDVRIAQECLASCWRTDVKEVADIVVTNFRRLMAANVGGPPPATSYRHNLSQ